MNYFLKAFPSNEWSGPAWYKPIFRKDEKFPKGFELVHFHPVDLGHGTATTIEAGETAKILTKTSFQEYSIIDLQGEILSIMNQPLMSLPL